jgi:hypothetical protein
VEHWPKFDMSKLFQDQDRPGGHIRGMSVGPAAVEAHVTRLRRPNGACGPAIDLRCPDACEEPTIKAAISLNAGALALPGIKHPAHP